MLMRQLDLLKLQDINNKVVGQYADYLIDKDYSNSTYNHYIKTLRYFYNYLIDKKEYDIKNPFKGFKLKSTKSTNSSLSTQDFFNLLKKITNKDSIKKIGKDTKKNMYKGWLQDFIKLKLYTGLRDFDITNLRWSMVEFKNNKPIVLIVPEHKTNQRNNNFKKIDFEYVYIPIGEELRTLLNKLGLKQNYNSNEYILEPNITAENSRYNFIKQSSRSFNFFYKKLENHHHHTLKDLRKTYTTALTMFFAKGISIQHKNYETTEKYYNDNRAIAILIAEQGFRVFPKI